jgi:L-asparaginase
MRNLSSGGSNDRERPRVSVVSTGGTIASTAYGGSSGVAPRLSAEELCRTVPQLSDVADIRHVSFGPVPSPDFTMADLLSVRDLALSEVRSGATGIVVTQGTSTLEESSFVWDLLWDEDVPLVVTGGMRNPQLPGADGPANILGAVQVAASPAARGLGTVVVFDNELFPPRYVHKTHSSSVSTFAARNTGPIGWVTEGRVRVAARPTTRYRIEVPSSTQPVEVALHAVCLGDTAQLLPELVSAGYRGLVIAGVGPGHVPGRIVDTLTALAGVVPVVLVAGTCGGETFTSTYEFRGSETDLLSRGLIGGGDLDGKKARLLLTLLLMGGADLGACRSTVPRMALPGGSCRFPSAQVEGDPRARASARPSDEAREQQ